MIIHCNMKVRPDEIWFLFSNDEFTNRRLEMAICPVCNHQLARLIEIRKIDGKVKDYSCSKKKAKRLIEENQNNIDYSSLDIPKQRNVLYGFRYGENKEKINKKTGEITVIQKACDFFGNKERIN